MALDLQIVMGAPLLKGFANAGVVPETDYLMGMVQGSISHHLFAEFLPRRGELPSSHLQLKDSKGVVLLPEGKKSLRELVYGDILTVLPSRHPYEQYQIMCLGKN